MALRALALALAAAACARAAADPLTDFKAACGAPCGVPATGATPLAGTVSQLTADPSTGAVSVTWSGLPSGVTDVQLRLWYLAAAGAGTAALVPTLVTPLWSDAAGATTTFSAAAGSAVVDPSCLAVFDALPICPDHVFVELLPAPATAPATQPTQPPSTSAWSAPFSWCYGLPNCALRAQSSAAPFRPRPFTLLRPRPLFYL